MELWNVLSICWKKEKYKLTTKKQGGGMHCWNENSEKKHSVTKSQITEPQKHNPAQPLNKICHRLSSAIPHFSWGTSQKVSLFFLNILWLHQCSTRLPSYPLLGIIRVVYKHLETCETCCSNLPKHILLKKAYRKDTACCALHCTCLVDFFFSDRTFIFALNFYRTKDISDLKLQPSPNTLAICHMLFSSEIGSLGLVL